MTATQQNIRAALDHVFARQDTMQACEDRDLGAIIRILGKHGITQGKVASLTGIAQGRLSEYGRNKRVPMGLSTFEAFADGLGMPVQARLALGLVHVGQTDASAYRCELNALTDTFDLVLLAQEIGKRGKDIGRQDVLALMAALDTTTAIAKNDVWEQLIYALTKPTALDEAIAQSMEYRSAGFHRLAEFVPAHILFKGLATHLKEISTLLNGTMTDPKNQLRTRLITVAGESSVLAGWIASDMGDNVTARNFYRATERVAKEIDDLEVVACSLACRSYIPGIKGAHGRARVLLTDALNAIPAISSPGTMSWLYARHAEESAALGDTSQALSSWARADEAFNVTDPAEDRAWASHVDQDRFDSFRIATYINIPSKLNEAQAIAENVLSKLAQQDTGKKRAAIIYENIAIAHLAHGSVHEAAELARAGLAIIREAEFAMWLPKFEDIGQGLQKWQKSPPVRAFLDELKMTKRQLTSAQQ